MKAVVSLVASVLLVAGTALANDSSADKAKEAFEASPAVKARVQALQAQGYTQADELESVMVSGGCGFAGCDAAMLVVQRLNTRGSNTRTQSVMALVKVPAVGATSLELVSLNKVGAHIEMPWTASSDSTQATLKKALVDAMKADQASPYPQHRITGDYGKVQTTDGKSMVSCEERKAPGLIQIQQFRCTIDGK